MTKTDVLDILYRKGSCANISGCEDCQKFCIPSYPTTHDYSGMNLCICWAAREVDSNDTEFINIAKAMISDTLNSVMSRGVVTEEDLLEYLL